MAYSTRKYWEFSEEKGSAKFKLVVKEQTLFVDATMLAESSPFFHTMFSGEGFKEQDEQMAKIEEETHKDILDLLQCLAPSALDNSGKKPIDASNFCSMARLAHKFQIATLTVACEHFIAQTFPFEDIADETLMKMMAAAAKYGLSKDTLATIIGRAATVRDLSALTTTDMDCPMAGKVMAAFAKAHLWFHSLPCLAAEQRSAHIWLADQTGKLETLDRFICFHCGTKPSYYCKMCSMHVCVSHHQISCCYGGGPGQPASLLGPHQKRPSVDVDMTLLN